MNIIQRFEAEQIARLSANRGVPDFVPGDTVRVAVKVVEGERTRTQAFEGVCIARYNAGSTATSPCARSAMARVWSACSRCIRR